MQLDSQSCHALPSSVRQEEKEVSSHSASSSTAQLQVVNLEPSWKPLRAAGAGGAAIQGCTNPVPGASPGAAAGARGGCKSLQNSSQAETPGAAWPSSGCNLNNSHPGKPLRGSLHHLSFQIDPFAAGQPFCWTFLPALLAPHFSHCSCFCSFASCCVFAPELLKSLPSLPSAPHPRSPACRLSGRRAVLLQPRAGGMQG